MRHNPSSRRSWLPPAQRTEEAHGFSTLPSCHLFLHPIALVSTAPPVSCFRPWSTRGRHIMRSNREPVGQSKTRGAPRRASTALLPASLVPASRRRDLGKQEQTCRSVLLETQYASLSSYAATGASLPQRNSVPSIHIRWSTVPILRASATFARFRPRRLATSIAQRLSVEKRVGRLSTTLAAS